MVEDLLWDICCGNVYIEGVNGLYFILFCPLCYCFIVFQTKWAATLQQKWHSLVGSNMSRQCLRLAASHLLSSILRWDLECRRFYAMNNWKHWIIFQELLSDIDIWRIQQRRRRRRTVPNRQVCLSCHFSGWVKLCDILSWGEEQGDLKWCSSGCETLCWENVSTISLFTLNGGIAWLCYHFYRKTIIFGKGVQAFKSHLVGTSEKAFYRPSLSQALDSFIACAPLIWCSFSQEVLLGSMNIVKWQ